MTTLLRRMALALVLVGAAQISAMAGQWTTDYAQALETAKAEKKNVLLDFTGSDWCGYCKILDKEVFASNEWKKVAEKNFVLVKVDFPQNKTLPAAEKAQNDKLAEKFNVQGYPYIVVINPAGKVLAKADGYEPGSGPTNYIAQLKSGFVK